MWQFIQDHCPKTFKAFENASMKCFPHQMFLQPLTSTWLRVGHSKVWGDKAQMMCGITCLRGFGQIVRPMVVCSMVVYPIVHSTTSLKSWMTKIPKFFETLIVKNNQSLEKSRFNVFQFFCKTGKRSPFTKDLIISTHPGFHIKVIRGQPKTQNSNENRGVQNESKVAF